MNNDKNKFIAFMLFAIFLTAGLVAIAGLVFDNTDAIYSEVVKVVEDKSTWNTVVYTGKVPVFTHHYKLITESGFEVTVSANEYNNIKVGDSILIGVRQRKKNGKILSTKFISIVEQSSD